MDIIGTAKTAMSKVGELADLAKKVGDIPLYEKIVSFQGQIVTLSQQVFEMNQELLDAKRHIKKLEEAQQTEKKVTRKEQAVVLEGDPNPYCQKCWFDEKKLIPLTSSANGGTCPKCTNYVRLSYFGFPYDPNAGLGRTRSDFDPFRMSDDE